MSTAFLSKVERNAKNSNSYSEGPAGFDSNPSPFNKTLPGFAPFSSTSKRMIVPAEQTPAPGSYVLPDDTMRNSMGASALRSAANRFVDEKSTSIPGPGAYALSSTIKSGKPKKFAKAASIPFEQLSPTLQTVPSIPNKFQSYGYEAGRNGVLELQDPINPGYSGVRNDRVGPGDYEPKIGAVHYKAPQVNFAKGADREAFYKYKAKTFADNPGPGYYNNPSTFDLLQSGGDGGNESDFLVRLNQVRKRKSAVFESLTARNSILQDAIKRIHEPGPGQYQLPAVIKSDVTKPPSQQFFSSSGPRFQEEQPRSNRLATAPGTYNPITSEFDQLRLKIMKQKKMASRSSWAQNVAFTSTESRFSQSVHNGEGPPPTAYHPKVGLADTLPKANPRGGAFGGTEQRFKEKKDSMRIPKDKQSENQINEEIQTFLSHLNKETPHTQPSRNARVFVRTAVDNRYRPESPGPPPGAYDTQPKWIKPVPVVMAPSSVILKKKPEILPGPGQYDSDKGIGKNFQNWKNPKNVMLSTANRDIFNDRSKRDLPGPGNYQLNNSGLLKPSFNVLLTDNY